MCNFLSVIVLKPGDGERPRILYKPGMDSHSDLMTEFKVRERSSASAQDQLFARIEFTPDWGNVTDLSKWTLRVDEERQPDWWNDIAEYVRGELTRMVNAMFVADGAVVSEGDHIAVGAITIEAKANCRVFALIGSTVTAWENSTVTARENSTVTAWGNSTVTARGNSTVTAWENSTVTAWENSTVTARENSTVTALENSTVTAWENSTVTARENSTVTARENSTVTAWGNSTVTASALDVVVIVRKYAGCGRFRATVWNADTGTMKLNVKYRVDGGVLVEAK